MALDKNKKLSDIPLEKIPLPSFNPRNEVLKKKNAKRNEAIAETKRSEQILLVQKFLNEQLGIEIGIDGIAGSETKQIIINLLKTNPRDLQAALQSVVGEKNMPVDGKVGNKTLYYVEKIFGIRAEDIGNIENVDVSEQKEKSETMLTRYGIDFQHAINTFAGTKKNATYDTSFANKVRDFQSNNGLEADGILGINTYFLFLAQENTAEYVKVSKNAVLKKFAKEINSKNIHQETLQSVQNELSRIDPQSIDFIILSYFLEDFESKNKNNPEYAWFFTANAKTYKTIEENLREDPEVQDAIKKYKSNPQQFEKDMKSKHGKFFETPQAGLLVGIGVLAYLFGFIPTTIRGKQIPGQGSFFGRLITLVGGSVAFSGLKDSGYIPKDAGIMKFLQDLEGDAFHGESNYVGGKKNDPRSRFSSTIEDPSTGLYKAFGGDSERLDDIIEKVKTDDDIGTIKISEIDIYIRFFELAPKGMETPAKADILLEHMTPNQIVEFLKGIQEISESEKHKYIRDVFIETEVEVEAESGKKKKEESPVEKAIKTPKSLSGIEKEIQNISNVELRKKAQEIISKKLSLKETVTDLVSLGRSPEIKNIISLVVTEKAEFLISTREYFDDLGTDINIGLGSIDIDVEATEKRFQEALSFINLYVTDADKKAELVAGIEKRIERIAQWKKEIKKNKIRKETSAYNNLIKEREKYRSQIADLYDEISRLEDEKKGATAENIAGIDAKLLQIPKDIAALEKKDKDLGKSILKESVSLANSRAEKSLGVIKKQKTFFEKTLPHAMSIQGNLKAVIINKDFIKKSLHEREQALLNIRLANNTAGKKVKEENAQISAALRSILEKIIPEIQSEISTVQQFIGKVDDFNFEGDPSGVEEYKENAVKTHTEVQEIADIFDINIGFDPTKLQSTYRLAGQSYVSEKLGKELQETNVHDLDKLKGIILRKNSVLATVEQLGFSLSSSTIQGFDKIVAEKQKEILALPYNTVSDVKYLMEAFKNAITSTEEKEIVTNILTEKDGKYFSVENIRKTLQGIISHKEMSTEIQKAATIALDELNKIITL